VPTHESNRLIPLRIVALVALLAGTAVSPVVAQFGGLGGAARRAAEEARKKAEEAKKPTDDAAKSPTAPAAAPAPAPAPSAPPAAAAPAAAASAPSFAVYSKFDFVPGEKVVAAEDFSQDAIGDFPAKWDTNASGEVVSISGQPGRWLKLTKAGFFLPELITELPDNFTFEFDLAVPPTINAGFALETVIAQLTDRKNADDWASAAESFVVSAHPMQDDGVSKEIIHQGGRNATENTTRTPQLAASRGTPVHIALWRQQQRVRVYMNQDKVWDLPRAASATTKFNSVVFYIGGGCGDCEYYLSNVRLATGAPDTRNKILTEGKWVSHGILFDVNSDRIKAESYGSLKEIAGVLSENAAVKVQIVGHTDSDGDDAANLDLSKRRAAAVKNALVTEFKIDGGRLETDGKGESQPIDKNDTPAGKANNRRVEFIKR